MTPSLGRATGRTLQYAPTEAAAAHQAFKAAVAEWLADLLSELFAAFRTGAVGMMTPAFEQLTGAKPRQTEAFFDQPEGKAA